MAIETNTIDDSEWEKIIVQLAAFTRSLTKKSSWFRGQDTTSFIGGKEIMDYVLEAVALFLEHPEKYDRELGSLIDYLKYNLIRGLVSNDVAKKENQTTVVISTQSKDDDGEDTTTPYLDRIAPIVQALFAEDIDYAAYKAYIESEISGDTYAENIMLGLYIRGMKRREIIEEFNMTESEYDNGVRRLNTVINKTASHFKEKRNSA